MVSVGVRLAAFNLPSIAKLTMTDELHLQELGERKIALFCCIPDSDKSLNYLVGMIYTQLIQTLYRQADRVHKGRLPVPVHCLMDEYANISLPKDTFLSALATMRSRAIFCSIIVQNMAQLKAMYKDDWESLVGLCDEFLYLGGTEKETHKYVSELLGKETISTTSYNQSKGRSGSYSINHQQSGRDLMTPDEVRLLDNSKCILFIRGERPVIDLKYNLLKHPNIRYTEDGGATPYDYTAADNALDDLPGAPENYELLDIEDVLTGVSKKNTGQLPQYYIENNHEGIVTKQTFREAQAEIARRNSKSATNHRKRHRGRYNSKYALSERLVCGDCGSSYKRVTWSIHGRKQIVWRCVNRLEYGTKFCSNSPSIPETELHQAILKAVQNLAAKFTGEVADQLNGILHQIEVGESLTPQLQAQLEQNQQEFDHLLEMSLDFDENTPFLDDKLKRLSDKIKQLKTAITQSSVNSQTPSTPTNPITAKDLLITEYDDMLTARIIEKIIVKSRQDLEIIFIGGYTQQISLQ